MKRIGCTLARLADAGSMGELLSSVPSVRAVSQCRRAYIAGERNGYFVGTRRILQRLLPVDDDMDFWRTLKDGLIVRERRIYDFAGLLIQIGLLKVKPAD